MLQRRNAKACEVHARDANVTLGKDGEETGRYLVRPPGTGASLPTFDGMER